MFQNSLRHSTIMLVICLLIAAEAFGGKGDSLRSAIGLAIEQYGELLSDGSTYWVDSVLALIDAQTESILNESVCNDTLLAKLLYIKSRCHLRRGDYTQAQDASTRAIEIWQSTPGEHLQSIVQAVDVLAACGRDKGNLIEWEDACQQRFALLNRVDKPLTTQERNYMVSALIDRGSLRISQGRYDEALEDYNQGIELVGEGVIDEPLLMSRLTGYIGVLLATQGKYAEGEEYALKCLELKRTIYPPKHYQMLFSYIEISNFIASQGDPKRAIPWADSAEALANELQTSHTVLSSLYRSKAKILLSLDSVGAALDYVERAVELNLSVSDYSTDRLMWSLGDAGAIAFSDGDVDLGVHRFDELVSRRCTFLNTVFKYASEDQKLTYLRKYSPILSMYLSGAAEYPKPNVNRGVLNMLLKGKGLAIEAMTADLEAAICSLDPTLDSLMAERRSICSEIAGLSLSDRSGYENTLKRLDELYEHKGEIEKELSILCSQFRFDQDEGAVSASAVATRLPERSILWEFVRFQRSDLHRLYEPDSDLSEYHYAALTLTPDDKITFVDLGSAKAIEILIAQYRSAMSDALRNQLIRDPGVSVDRYNRVSADLYQILIAPLEETLTEADQVYVAADGAICLLPFETLTDDGKRYLIEDHQFVYLTSGRDLLEKESESNGTSAIVMADPDYMMDPVTSPVISDSTSLFALRGSGEPAECLASMFSPLPMTRLEGSVIAKLLRQAGGMHVSYFEADQAREWALKNLQEPPRVLHIATHGYFCAEAERTTLSNPLLRSGLLLAGANRTIGHLNDNQGNYEDGILTALEASGLNLVGTELVTLSACQTGIGEVQSGEGVFGLRRAFLHAGARSLVMSMFAVPDESTASLMEHFYSNWLSGQSKSAALRNASLSMLNERRENGASTLPIFWGGFVLVGDPE